MKTAKKIFIILFIFLFANAQETLTNYLWKEILPHIDWHLTSFPHWIKLKENSLSREGFFQILYKDKNVKFHIIKHERNGNIEFIKLQQFFKGIKVKGGELQVLIKDNYILSYNGHLINRTDITIPTTPNISFEEALNKLNRLVKEKTGASRLEFFVGNSVKYIPNIELVLYNVSTNNWESPKYLLFYVFDVKNTEERIYISASKEEKIIIEGLTFYGNNKKCTCCQGTTTTLFYGAQNITTRKVGFRYRLEDKCRGEILTLYCISNPFVHWVKVYDPNNNFSNLLKDRRAATAHWATEMSYDYFFSQHQRKGFDNKNGAIQVEVNSCDGTDNAKWSNNRLIIYSKGSRANEILATLDMVGHEFTHGVIQHSSQLAYSNESGALNESFADIFGTMIEFYALNGNGNYFIAEKAWKTDGYMRNMANPKAKTETMANNNCFNNVLNLAQPNTYKGINWIDYNNYPNCDYGGVHINSGVQNYWFYLLAEGGSGVNDHGTPYNVQGIGREKAAAIAYRNMTVYLTSTSNYNDAKIGAIWAAIDLFGECSNEVIQTINAWNAVGVPASLGFAYNLTLDCQNVQNVLNIPSDYEARAINQLTASCNITSINPQNKHVELVAGKRIILKPGFRSGNNFRAYISPCLGTADKIQKNSTNNTETLFNTENFPKNNYSKLRIYPNPTSDKFTIEIPEKGCYEIQVRNLVGETILQEKTCESKTQISMQKFPSGIYLVQILGENSYFGKIVKQ